MNRTILVFIAIAAALLVGWLMLVVVPWAKLAYETIRIGERDRTDEQTNNASRYHTAQRPDQNHRHRCLHPPTQQHGFENVICHTGNQQVDGGMVKLPEL